MLLTVQIMFCARRRRFVLHLLYVMQLFSVKDDPLQASLTGGEGRPGSWSTADSPLVVAKL